MQNKTSLGRTLGSLFSGFTGDSESYGKGMEAGARSASYGANAEQSLAQAAKTAAERREIDRRGQFQTPEGMRNIAEISSGTDNDLARMIEQNLRRENVPLDSLPGGGAQDFYPGYKEAKQNERGTIAQLMAGLGLGDKSVDLQKVIQGVTANSISGPLRDPAANVQTIANALSAFNGTPAETGRGVAIQKVNETRGIDPLVAALVSMGKDPTGERLDKKQQSSDRRYNTYTDAITSRSDTADTIKGAMDRHMTRGAGNKDDKAVAEERDAINAVDLSTPIKRQVPLTNPRYVKFANIYNAAQKKGDYQAMRKLRYYAVQEGLVKDSEE